MRKIISIALVALLLVGCGETGKKETPEMIFKSEISEVYEIENSAKAQMMEELSRESVEEIINEKIDKNALTKLNINYGVEDQGIGTDGNGNRVICYKLPVNITFVTTSEGIKSFVSALKNITTKISVAKIEIKESEDQYSVACVVNFLGNMNASSFSKKGGVSVQMNAGEDTTKKTPDTLRDFDLNLTLRPSNSDSSAISIGVKDDSGTCLYNDNNSTEEITINFTKENGKYYCEYGLVVSNQNEKAQIKPGNEILFDILSCKRVLDDDEIGANITLNNSTDKKVNILVYGDRNERVKFIEKTGKVEVNKN